jgi:(2R)-3-sulfolactate dehydrogenase (NADP+)
MVANKEGKSIPEGWALDSAGQPTRDPKAALSGSMVPMGDAKGAALALMVEILSAALTGSNFAYEASSFFSATGPAPRVGHLLLLLNPTAFDADNFAERVSTLFEAIISQPGARLPGDRRLARRVQTESIGVTLPDNLYKDICERAGS